MAPQGKSDASRIQWNSTMDEHLIGVLKEEHLTGGRHLDGTWKHDALAHAAKEVFDQTGEEVTVEHVRARRRYMQDKYKKARECKEKNGFGWNASTQLFTADNIAWKEFVTEHPKYKSFRSKQVPFYDDLDCIFGEEKVTGLRNFEGSESSAHVEPPLDDCDNGDDNEIQPSTSTSSMQTTTSGSRKKRRRMAESMEENMLMGMVEAAKEIAKALKPQKCDHIERTLRQLPDMTDDQVFDAAVAWEAGKPLVIEEVEVQPPQAMEVRVKILYTSLCRTDIYFWEAKGQTPLFPRIFGHEAGGIVESVGSGVTDLQPGDHVLPVFTGECKECAHCKSEESNMCDLLRINTDRGVMLNDGKSRFSIKGKPVYHFVGTSTFSEYTVVHVGCLAKINPDAPLEKVCILSCGITTGLGAALNVAKPKPGSSVAIFGLGAVGLAAAEGARISGASRIIGVGLNSNRFNLAKKFGVTEFVNPKDHDKPIQEVIAAITDGGVDRSIECTGSINAMISAFECVHDGWGVAVLVGVPNKDDVFKTHPMNLLNGRTLKGTFFGNYKPRSDLPSVVEKYMNKELELEKFITHEVSFSEINKAFDYMLRGDGLRCIIRVADA